MTTKKTPVRGFTLIEILIVIGIIAILASIVIIAINPAKQFAQARNSQRVANTNAILNAIGQRIADNKGIFEGEFEIDGDDYTCGTLPDTKEEITTAEPATPGTESSGLGCLVPTYIPALPAEPNDSNTSDNNIEYTVQVLSNGRIEVCAPESLNEDAVPVSDEICVTR